MQKQTLLVLSCSLVLLVLLSGCNPERIAARSLEGDWDVTSYTVDGQELMGADISRFTMEFEEYDGDEGDFDIDINFADGRSSIFSGDYELNSDGDEIDFDYDAGGEETYDLTIDDNDLELNGNIDGFRVVIVAERD